LEHFGKEANLPVRSDSDVLCTTEYSRILPLENGEVSAFRKVTCNTGSKQHWFQKFAVSMKA